MPIEKNMTIDDLPGGDVAVEMEDDLPSDIDIEFDAETGASKLTRTWLCAPKL